MMVDLDLLVADFADAAVRTATDGWPCTLDTKILPAPHQPPALRAGFAAVYGFALSATRGTSPPAGAGTVLKVGKVGASSNARFSSQHYNPASAGSTLAGSLLANRILWPWLGIDLLDSSSVKVWMLSNLDRFHIFVPSGRPAVLASLEIYIRARVGSIFEGSASR